MNAATYYACKACDKNCKIVTSSDVSTIVLQDAQCWIDSENWCSWVEEYPDVESEILNEHNFH